MGQKVKLEKKAHFFIPSNKILIIGFLATFEVTGDTNRIYKGVAIWVFPFFCEERPCRHVKLAYVRNHTFSPVVALVNTLEPTTPKNLFCSYLEVADYLLMKFAIGNAFAGMDSAILRNTQPTTMIQIQYAHDCSPSRA